MRIDQALKEGTPVLCVAELELELGELGDSLDVCTGSHRFRQRISGDGASEYASSGLRLRFSRDLMLRFSSSRASLGRPCV